jgi:cell division protein FtsB
MLDSIKQRIEKVKGKTTAIEDTKVSYQDQLSQIEHKQTKIREQIAKLK